MRRDLSCMWLIFLFISLPWNIQTNGQYPNWASTNDFSKSLLCWKLIRFDNLDKTDSFLPAFLQTEETYSSKVKSLSITTPILDVIDNDQLDVLLFISIFWSDILRLFESNINQEEFYLAAICSWRPDDLYYAIYVAAW